MRTIELYEGVFQPANATEELKKDMMENVIQFLSAWGVQVTRHVLQADPKAFENEAVHALLQAMGEDALPITLVDGVVKKSGDYPTSDELVQFSGFEEEEEGDHEDGCDCGCEHGENCDCCEDHHHHHR